MKKLIYLFVASVLLFTSCEKASKLTEIKLPLTKSITIPATPIAGPVSITTPEIKTGIDSVLNAAGVSSKSIEDITLRKMSFVLTASKEDFSFLKSANVSLIAEGKEAVKIATAMDITKVMTLDFKTIDVDLKDYILKDKFSLKIDFETKTAIETPKDIKINLEFLLDLNVLGL